MREVKFRQRVMTGRVGVVVPAVPTLHIAVAEDGRADFEPQARRYISNGPAAKTQTQPYDARNRFTYFIAGGLLLALVRVKQGPT